MTGFMKMVLSPFFFTKWVIVLILRLLKIQKEGREKEFKKVEDISLSFHITFFLAQFKYMIDLSYVSLYLCHPRVHYFQRDQL